MDETQAAAPEALEHEMTAAPQPAPSADAVIDAWFAELHGNLPVLRETQNWNHMQEQIARLKAALK